MQSHVEWIWQRLINDYIPQLQRRNKWVSDSACPLNVGTFVWVMDSNNPRGSFPLSRVEQLHFGDDGRVRPATVKTETSSLVSPLVKSVP